MFCYVAVAKVKPRLGYDDSLDVFGIHGIGGLWGTLATGLFAEKAVNAAGANGLFFGNARQFLVQCLLFVVAGVFAVVATWIIYKVVDAIMGMRVDAQSETIGLDLTQHNESAYTMLE